MPRHTLLALCALAVLALSGCESVRNDINTSFDNSLAGLQQTFSHFQPFPETPPAGTVVAADAPVTAQMPVQPLEKTIKKNPQHTSAPEFAPVPARAPRRARQDSRRASAPVPSSAPENDFVERTDSGMDCPAAHIVQELNRVHQFYDTAQTPDQATSAVRMDGLETRCKRVGGSLAIDMTIAFNGALGPKGRMRPHGKPSFSYPYFVAITGPHGHILAKEVFALTLSYNKKDTHIAHTEMVRQVIPLQNGNAKADKILIGFQISDQELAYNRTHPETTKPTAGKN